MKNGWIKVAAVSPVVSVADPAKNAEEILRTANRAVSEGAKIIVFPELALSGFTCRDLFLQDTLVNGTMAALQKIVKESKKHDALMFIGLPVRVGNKLYNAAAAVQGGELLALIPKVHLVNGSGIFESRYFAPGNREVKVVSLPGFGEVLFGSKILFECPAVEGLQVAAEICADFWVPDAPHIAHARAGATVLVNLSTSDELAGKHARRRKMLQAVSERILAGYVFADSGDGESSGEGIYTGSNFIAENGKILAESNLLQGTSFGEPSFAISEIDIQSLMQARKTSTTFTEGEEEGYVRIVCEMKESVTKLTRHYSAHPFFPEDEAERKVFCEEVLSIQARALARRLAHTHSTQAVLGISGGLDSTLALLVTARAFDLLKLPRKQIVAVTMPAFGTTDRTYSNACGLTKALHATLREINIKKSILQHFADIGHDEKDHDVTYENAQARERTQILMDIANEIGALVVGTGDMSEMALGWATYNGDHMSMYGVNAGVPKTLLRHLVFLEAEKTSDSKVRKVLLDVLDTPVSPELLPPTKDGKIAQKTEDLVGPYELHDFFLYHLLQSGFSPAKIYRLAVDAFRGTYSKAVILKWMKTFYRRFFNQQFKRSCMPDGPKALGISLSPRGGLMMPSDAVSTLWMEEVETLK
ncbi:MAG: NAD(+) synthase [Lachnospiraceae bacterium]|nr:NAD(+) synthase [Lachnospiraceae bacterium]